MSLSDVQLRNMEGEQNSNSKSNLTDPIYRGPTSLPLVILVVAIGLVSVVSIIVAAVALSRPTIPNVTVNSPDISLTNGASGSQGQSASPQLFNSASPIDGRKVWLISIGHDYGAHEYIDAKGYLRGFSYDIMREACAAAGIDCRTVWDRYNRCWESKAGSHPVGGEGILGRYYDGCWGWYTTIDRIHVLSFSQAYLKPPKAVFYVKKGNPNSRSASDITGLRVGFIDGWASDEKCVARLPSTQVNGNYPIADVLHFADATTLADKIAAGEVDIGFVTIETMEKFVGNQIEIAPSQPSEGWQCLLAGNALMARKDSPLINYINDGFQKLRASGRLTQLCEEGQAKHGVHGSIGDCVDS